MKFISMKLTIRRQVVAKKECTWCRNIGQTFTWSTSDEIMCVFHDKVNEQAGSDCPVKALFRAFSEIA